MQPLSTLDPIKNTELWTNQRESIESVLKLLESRDLNKISIYGLSGTGKSTLIDHLKADKSLSTWAILTPEERSSLSPRNTPDKIILICGHSPDTFSLESAIVHRSLTFDSLIKIPTIKTLLESKPEFVSTIKSLCAIGLGSESITKALCKDLGNQVGERAEDLLKIRLLSFVSEFINGFELYDLESAAKQLLRFVPVEENISAEEITETLKKYLPKASLSSGPTEADFFLIKAFNAISGRTYEIEGSALKYLKMSAQYPREPRLKIMVPLPEEDGANTILNIFLTDFAEIFSKFRSHKIDVCDYGRGPEIEATVPRKTTALLIDKQNNSYREIIGRDPEHALSAFKNFQNIIPEVEAKHCIYITAADHNWTCASDILAFLAIAESICQKLKLPYYFYADANCGEPERDFHYSYLSDGENHRNIDWI